MMMMMMMMICLERNGPDPALGVRKGWMTDDGKTENARARSL